MSTIPLRAFIYVRKSTDNEDRQVFSLPHQLKEVRDLACRFGIDVVEELQETRSAKAPGRPLFTSMLSRIEKGEASIILAWDADRIARNLADGVAVITLVERGLLNLKFVASSFEATPQGILSLLIAFGMAKFHIDAMSAGVKRSYKNRIQEGHWPRRPPLGYLFDRNTRTAVVDPTRGPLVRQVFELYATGHYSLADLARIMNDERLRGFPNRHHGPLPPSLSQYHAMLQNPFYAGILRYRGEPFEGRHERLIPLALFDQCQLVLAQRGRRSAPATNNHLYRRIFRCGHCGCMITNEVHKGHTYLRCTRKKGPCSQPFVREHDITAQIKRIISKLAVPPEIVQHTVKELELEQTHEAAQSAAAISGLKAAIARYDDKHRRLRELYVDGSMPAEDFHKHKEKLLRERRACVVRLAARERSPQTPLEPAIRFIRGLTEPRIVAESDDPVRIRDYFTKVGSNLILANGRVRWTPRGPWKYVAPQRFSRARRSSAPAPAAGDDAVFSSRCPLPRAARPVVLYFGSDPAWV